MSVRDVSVRLSATVAPFKAQMAAAGSAVSQFGSEVQAAAAKHHQAAHDIGVGLAGIGAAAVAMAAVSVKAAIDVDTAMRNVSTVSDEVSNHFGSATDKIVALSTELPQSAKVLADALYQVSSAGFDGAAAMELVEVSGTVASAGLTDAGTAATALTGVLNAYGLSVGDATAVSDIMFQTVNLGVLTMSDLTQQLGDVVPIAASAGISFDQAAAALAAITLSGVPAAQAATALAGVIRGLLDPSEALTATFQAQGFASAETALQSLGLKGVMDLLRQSTGGVSSAYLKLFPDLRAANGAMSANADNGALYARVFDEIADKTNRAGATQEALAKQSEGLGFQLTLLHNQVMALAIGFGQTITPALGVAADAMGSLIAGFSALPAPLQTIIGLAALVVGGIALVGGALLLLGPRIMATQALLVTLAQSSSIAATGIGFLQAAILPVSAILAVATVAIGLFGAAHASNTKHVDEFTEALKLETVAAEAAIQAIINKRIADNDLDEIAQRLGLSVDTVSQAMRGNATAMAEIEAVGKRNVTHHELQDAGYFKLKNSVHGLNAELGDARDKHVHLAAVEKATGTATAGATTAMTAQDLALQSLGKSLSGVASVTNIMAAATAAQTTAADAAKAKLEERHQIEKAALDQSRADQKVALDALNQTAKDALDRDNKALKDALEDRQKIELDALALTQRAVTDALDVRFRAESDAWDREARGRKDTLDDQQRAEEEALDDRLALLDDEFDQRKKAENRTYQAEVDRVQGLIDSTFGPEREGYKTQLLTLEDSHDQRLNALDAQKKAEARTQKDALADKTRAEKEGLNDVLGIGKQAIADRQAAEKQAATDAYDAQVAALKTRQDTDTAAQDVALGALVTSLDLRQQANARAIDTRQNADDAAADIRRTKAQAAAALTLADAQTQLDALNKVADGKLVDLQTIFQRGGSNATVAMMVELDKMTPAFLTSLAKAPQPAVDQFMTGLKNGMRDRSLEVAAVFTDAGKVAMAAFAGVLAAPKGTVSEGLFGVLAPILAGHIEGHAAGGPVNGLSWVGEEGPELFAGRGTIIPAGVSAGLSRWAQSASAGISAGSGGGSAGGGGSGAPIYNIDIRVEARVDAGIDMGTAGAAITKQIRSGIDFAIDDLARQVTVKAWRN